MRLSRWRIPLVLAVTVFVHYIDRNNLAIALPAIAHDFGWSDKEIGKWGEWLLGAFYITFGLAQIVLSPFAERWGPKRGLMLAIIGFSLCTILVYPLGGSLLALIGLRLLLGVAESVHMPMNSAIVARWFAFHERGRANSIYVAGILVALATAPLVIVPLVGAFSWRFAFAILGFAGLAVSLPLVAWLIPLDQPHYASSVASGRGSYTDWHLWLYITAGALNAFCVFGVLNWLPTYLNRTKGVEFGELSLPLFAVFFSGIVGIFFWAFIGDKVGHRVRWASLGLGLAGLAVLLTAWVDSAFGVVVLFAIGVFFQSSYNAQEFATLQQHVEAERAGAFTGLYNGLTVLVGGVGGSLVPGTIVAITGSFQAGLLSVVASAFGVAVLMGILSRSGFGQEKGV